MPEYLVKLLSKKEVAEKTTAFFFEKPKGFRFVPGQFIEITLNKETYPFSIASSPKEKDLMITTRMRASKFKNSLKKLKIGSRVKIDGPFGQFILHKNKNIPAVFLAGGIGITMPRSIIKNHPDRKIILFYSNRKQKDAAFLEELKKLESKNQSTQRNLSARPSSQHFESSGFKMIAIMTREPVRPVRQILRVVNKVESQAQGKNGKHINPKMLKDNLKDWRKSIYYAVGSTGFVQSMAALLAKMKIKPEQIKTENFSGY